MEEEEEREEEKSFYGTNEECEASIRDIIEINAVYEFVLMQADNVLKVKSFLSMVVTRMRYLKLRKSSIVIQKYMRRYRANMLLSKLKQERRDKENMAKL